MTSPKSAALARNRTAGAEPARVVGPPVAMRRTVAVVTRDDALADTLRRAIPSRSVMVVATPVALADLLLQEHTAVLVIDAAVPGDHCARLVEHLALQFPELQLIAVGSRADETALAAALSDGRLFRFMHRPYSLARARTFVEAALERYDGLQAAPRDARIRRVTSVGFALAALLLVAALVSALRSPAVPTPLPPARSAAATVAPASGPVSRAATHRARAPERHDATPAPTPPPAAPQVARVEPASAPALVLDAAAPTHEAPDGAPPAASEPVNAPF